MNTTAPPATTIFERMSGLARELGAINLGQGFPDLPEPPELLRAAQDALVTHGNQYPPMRGLPDLRAAVAAFYARTQGLEIAAEDVIVTSGATEALAASILGLLSPGDEAILLQPFYDAYLPLVERAGGTARTVSLVPPDWRIPLDRLEAAITPATRLIILCTPNNPTATLVDRETLEGLATLCERHDLLLLSDEVWEAMILDGTPHLSPMHIERLRDRTVKVGSAGKIFSLTGWKVGWAVAPPHLAARIAGQHQWLTYTTATPLQWAVAEGLALPAQWHEAHRARYAEGRAVLSQGLAEAGFVPLPSAATWFLDIDLAASGLPADDVAVAERLIREAGVASIPLSVFYRDAPERGYLRLCFAKRRETLEQAVERLAGFLRGI